MDLNKKLEQLKAKETKLLHEMQQKKKVLDDIKQEIYIKELEIKVERYEKTQAKSSE